MNDRGNETSMDARQRARTIAAAQATDFDLVVVGGGINGAGIAHDAALRGLKVCLLEARDLAFGTSSRSSKLIHGGLRYLEHYHFRLVFEGTNERAMLRKLAPHLVRPLLFALPVYETDRHPLWKIQVGMWMYDGLSLFKTEHRHVALRSPKRLLEREPLLRTDGLTGGIIYYDCLTDDARLTLENALAAAQLGVPVITRAKVVGVDGLHDKGTAPVTVRVADQLDGKEWTLRAKGVVNATGVWTDSVRRAAHVDGDLIRPTKGVHIVFEREKLPVNHAVALVAPQDGRVFFAIPWNGRTVIGTTDTDDAGEPGALTVTMADVEYLLTACNHAFPSARLQAKDVISAWVGLRPLIKTDAESASDVPREHQVFKDGRMVTIAGGKLTTYRRMAAETVDAAVEAIGARAQESVTATTRLPGAVGLEDDIDGLATTLSAESGVPPDVALRLAHVYGVRARGVLAYVARDRSLGERLDPSRDVLRAEVVHAVDHELALTVDDVMVRRTSLSLTAADQGRKAAREVADLMAARLGWDAATRQRNLDEFARSADLVTGFRNERA